MLYYFIMVIMHVVINSLYRYHMSQMIIAIWYKILSTYLISNLYWQTVIGYMYNSINHYT